MLPVTAATEPKLLPFPFLGHRENLAYRGRKKLQFLEVGVTEREADRGALSRGFGG